MDPQACLDRLWNAYQDSNAKAFAEAARDLSDWITKGGYAPTVEGDLFLYVVSRKSREIGLRHRGARFSFGMTARGDGWLITAPGAIALFVIFQAK